MSILTHMRRVCLLIVLLMCTAARAAVVSTIDEWAARFMPEVGPKLDLPAYADAYDRAAAQIDAGRYRLALCTIAGIEKPDLTRAGILRAKALSGLGEWQDAVAVLDALPGASEASVLLAKAQILIEDNQFGAAQAPVDALMKAVPDALTSRLLHGQLLEARGDFTGAIGAYRWFLDPPQSYLSKWQNDPSQFESADDIVTFATAIQRWATLTMALKDTPQLNDTLLSMFTRAFDVVDRGNIAARIAAAEFALSHSDAGTAAKTLAPLANVKSTNRQMLQITARWSTVGGDEKTMERAVDELRDENPDSVDAGVLELAMLTRARSGGAYAKAAALYKQRPDDPNAVGAYIAIAYFTGHEEESKRALAAEDERAPRTSQAYIRAAEFLEMAFQRDEAARLLKKSIARTPWETEPRHLLGDIYLNDGYDDQAKAVLDEAYALDPYNVKTLNYLRLLEDLSKYDKRVSEHFIIYSDKEADPIAADQIGTFMEQAYVDVCGVFHYQPQTKIVVQIYSEDDDFSVRLAGVPGVENYGVSFGRVLATIAPRAGTSQGNFNFSRVLKHEFVHTINLLQTNQHCPRWFTEGLAVWQEGVPFRFVDVPPELYKRTMNDELFSVRSFPLAFLRPTRPGDGEQAYTQAAYLARYLDETYGADSIVRILDAYGRSENDDKAFFAATGKSIPGFEKDWHAWMVKTIKPWGYDDASAEQSAKLQTDGETAIKAKDYPEALRLWQQACDLQPAEMKPHQRLAFLYLQPAMADPAKAIEHLKFLHFLELSDNRYAKQISRLYGRLNDGPSAIAWAKQATYVNLYDSAAHQMLADAYTKTGDAAQAEAERLVVSQISLWQQKQDLRKKGVAPKP